MLLNKQINLYRQIVKLQLPISTGLHKQHFSTGHNYVEENSLRINADNLSIVSTQIVTETSLKKTYSYSLAVINKGGLKNIPHKYTNTALLARCVYNHLQKMKCRNLCINIPRIY